ncbi:hypothetical protein J9303_02750 [Bacillaceae bacterium Marseille-Q3522]|nr:hypothetical protein [Bacillaceae bacterium Marseille-Q3522]
MLFWKQIDGIYLWNVNRNLKKMALSKHALLEQTEGNTVKLPLPGKPVQAFTAPEIKANITAEIEQLDGFESLKICLLEDIKPLYKEQITKQGLSRWIEISLTDPISYQPDVQLKSLPPVPSSDSITA